MAVVIDSASASHRTVIDLSKAPTARHVYLAGDGQEEEKSARHITIVKSAAEPMDSKKNAKSTEPERVYRVKVPSSEGAAQ